MSTGLEQRLRLMETLEKLISVQTVRDSLLITETMEKVMNELQDNVEEETEKVWKGKAFAKLGQHRMTRFPFNCRPEKMVVIDDIHPIDPKYNQRAEFIGKPFILKTTGVSSVVRTENRNIVGKQRSFASVPMKAIFSDEPIIYFHAVNFHLAKKEEKHGKDICSDSET